MKFQLPDLCLTLFDGGAAADGGGQAANSGETNAAPAAAGRGRPGETKAVRYGRQAGKPAAGGGQGQAPDAGEQKQAEGAAHPDSREERRRAFMAMVSGEGEFKEAFDEQVQRLMNKRWSETQTQTQELQKRLGQMQPILDLLAQRYKVDGGDVSRLMTALENDSAYWSQAAEQAGMSVEQYKRFQALQRENAELLRQQRERQGQERMNAQLRAWNDQAEAMKELYPRFDLNEEVRDPQFLSMLRSGVPVQHAYEVLHMDEIKAGVAKMQAKATEKQVVDGIRAKGARPQENGTSAQSGFTVKDDVHKLTRKDRAEIARRAARGEIISF